MEHGKTVKSGTARTDDDYEQLQLCSDSCSAKFKVVKKLCTALANSSDSSDKVTIGIVQEAKKMLSQFEENISVVEGMLWKTKDETTSEEVIEALKTTAGYLTKVLKLETQLKSIKNAK